MYPKVYLAIDNCVLYKRWTRPDEWAKIIRDIGINYIEASADNELDPLYTGEEHLARWVGEVRDAQEKYSVKIANLYSGHGSYTTLGIAHPEASVRKQMVNCFFKPLIKIAGQLDCGMGFFAHAFENRALQSPDIYAQYVKFVEDALVEINTFAGEVGCGDLGIEKMYTPHQYPWRNDDVKELLRNVTRRSAHDFYFTEDVGHHAPKFTKPNMQYLSDNIRGVWLGSDEAYRLAHTKGDNVSECIQREVENNPQLFMSDTEGGCYETLRELGCYSPIIHLQQTNGALSAHLPFTDSENKKGIITGEKVLRTLKESYDRPIDTSMPKRVENIYMTLELFSGTTSIMNDVLDDCRESAKYWRKFIPKDGIYLDELIKMLD